MEGPALQALDQVTNVLQQNRRRPDHRRPEQGSTGQQAGPPCRPAHPDGLGMEAHRARPGACRQRLRGHAMPHWYQPGPQATAEEPTGEAATAKAATAQADPAAAEAADSLAPT